MGKVEKGPSGWVYSWNGSDTACPTVQTVEYNLPLDRVESSSFPDPTTIVCTAGANPTGLNTIGKPGLDGAGTPGISQGPVIPPPFQPKAFPPQFSTPGGPADAEGIWFDDAKTTAELVGNSTFSSVALLADNTFLTVLGRFDSFNCTGIPGTYEASLTYTLTPQKSGTSTSGVGCTAGTVDLSANTYEWQPANATACPDVPLTNPAYSMKRVGASQQ